MRFRTPLSSCTYTLAVACLTFLTASCSAGSSDAPMDLEAATPGVLEASSPKPDLPNSTIEVDSSPPALGLTYHRPDGNRFAAGKGSLPEVRRLEIPLQGTPVWLVAAPAGSTTIWVVVLEDGQVQAFSLQGQSATPLSITPESLAAPSPPLLLVQDQQSRLIFGFEKASPLTHPIFAIDYGAIVYLSQQGDVIASKEDKPTRFALQALPDARPIVHPDGRLILLTQATRRYDHGVLGDDLEAGGFHVLRPSLQGLDVAASVTLPGSEVFEATAPLLADLNNDEELELVLTVSDAESGSRIRAYDMNGTPLAEGPSIGQGYRWRHALVAAPFGPSGEIELAVVRTPHIGGVVEFYRMEGHNLRILAELSGFRSHVLGSRNLDMALAGDFDGDGVVELLLPEASLTTLAAVSRTPDGAQVDWQLPLDAPLSTNLAASTDGQKGLLLGLGVESGALYIWTP